jgi:hypothetical protein
MEENIHIKNKVNHTADTMIYAKNLNTNREKFQFYNFLINSTKIEIHIDMLQSYFFWVGILEYFIWLVLLALFISSPSEMQIVWAFFYHNARATLGLFIVKYIPGTHTVIENLREYESSSLDEIQRAMDDNYRSLLGENERTLKPMLIIYLVITVISLLVDFILFWVFALHFNQDGIEHKEFICMIAVIAYLIADVVYFSFFLSLDYSFPPDVISAVKKGGIGLFSELKDGISKGFSNVVARFKRKAVTEAVERAI